MGLSQLPIDRSAANPPACRVYHDAAQSIANGTETSLAFNSERYDTAAMHDTATNNSRITIGAAGLYVITTHIEFATNVTGQRYAFIRLNGATILAMQTGWEGAGGVGLYINLATTERLAAADYLEVRVYQNSGAALNVTSTARRSPEFTATWVGLG